MTDETKPANSNVGEGRDERPLPQAAKDTLPEGTTVTTISKTTLHNRIGWLRAALTLKPKVRTLYQDVKVKIERHEDTAVHRDHPMAANAVWRPGDDAELSKEAVAKIGEWLISGNTGISSEFMAGVALGASPEIKSKLGGPHPHDGADFGRCLRLVERVPEIHAAFSAIATHGDRWADIINRWDILANAHKRKDGKFYELLTAKAKEKTDG